MRHVLMCIFHALDSVFECRMFCTPVAQAIEFDLEFLTLLSPEWIERREEGARPPLLLPTSLRYVDCSRHSLALHSQAVKRKHLRSLGLLSTHALAFEA